MKAEYLKIRQNNPHIPASQALEYVRDLITISELESRFEIELTVMPEDLPLRGNLICSGDNRYDRKLENETIDRLESGDVWAWCIVEVRLITRCKCCGSVKDSFSDFLGGCSYAGPSEFKAGGYYLDMIKTVIAASGVDYSMGP